MDKEKFIKEFKENNPIRDCLGCTGGRWKWRRVLDCIDLRYGHATKKAAEMDRAVAARDAAAVEEYNQNPAQCGCGTMTTRRFMDQTGQCEQCVERTIQVS